MRLFINKTSEKKILFVFIAILIVASSIFSFISIGFAFENQQISSFNMELDNDNAQHVSIIMTNDVHAYAVNEPESAQLKEKMGYAYLAGFVEKSKTEQKANGDLKYSDVDLVSAGDDISGGAGYGFMSKGKAIAKLMCEVGYNVVTPGNHEFNYGISVYDEIVSTLKDHNCQTVSCNFEKKQPDGSFVPYFMPFYTKTWKNNKKVAYIGISTPETLTRTSPKNFMDEYGNIIYSFNEDQSGTAFYNKIQDTINYIKDTEHPDCIVALSHLGNSDTVTDVYRSENMIKNVSGIDVCLDAHSHGVYERCFIDKEGKQVLCVQGGYYFQNLEAIDIAFNDDGSKNITSKLYSTEDIKKIPGIQQTKQYINLNESLIALEKWYKDQTGRNIGRSDIDLDKDDIYTKEKAIGNFVTDAYKMQYDADIAIVNGGGIKSGIDKGPLTVDSMIRVNLFANDTVKLKTKGYRILDMLEFNVRDVGTTSSKQVKYQVSGVTFNIRKDINSNVEVDKNGLFVGVNGPRRVQNVKINGTPIIPNKEYTIAGISYILSELGGGLTAFNHDDTKIIPIEPPVPDYECLVNYVEKTLSGVISSEKYGHIEGRFNFIDGPSGPNTIYYCNNNIERGNLPADTIFMTETKLAEKGIIGQTGHVCIGWTTSIDTNNTNAKHYDFEEIYNNSSNLLLYPEWSNCQISINSAIVSNIDNQIAYQDGSPIEPDVDVYVNISNSKIKLQKNLDYTLSYQNNINPGIATVIISATNFEYTGETQTNFIINPYSPTLNNNDVTFSNLPQTGDYRNMSIYCIVILLILITIIFSINSNKYKNKK